ncbi:MAG: D-alanyl-D-alanine carboxypeptidase [Rhodoglobus sp.]
MPRTHTRRQIYRRRRVAVFGGAALVLATAFYLPLTLLAPLQAVDATIAPYPTPAVSQPALTFPGYGAAAIGAVGYPGVLAASGVADPLPIASIAKVITALVVLDAKPLAPGEAGPDIVFGEADLGFTAQMLALDGVVEGVSAGQVMSQRDVLNVMLLTSANNYAMSLANWAFGSIEGYVAAAGAWLAREGLTATVITEPTGIQASDVSSAADLVEIARRVIADPVLAEIVATPAMEVAGLGAIENRNGLLGVDGIDGIKTGTLDESGACLLFSWDHAVGSQTVTLVGVVLGGPDHATIDAAIRQLLGEVDAGFSEVTLATQGQPFASYRTAWGDEARAVAAETTTAAVWAATTVQAAVAAGDVTLGEVGTEVGTVTFNVAERTFTVPLVLDTTIDDPGPWWRLTNPDKLF